MAISNFTEPAKKIALITVITGQDGAYLAEFGIKRRSSLFKRFYQASNSELYGLVR
ncbi:MAG: hypothetical protein L0H15_03735 [Nitrosospira sp.]|nr:hypothetical protein [Nitrosospira sp.]MDN5934787.1 hypothetical protein [Nitrosospira sp.]